MSAAAYQCRVPFRRFTHRYLTLIMEFIVVSPKRPTLCQTPVVFDTCDGIGHPGYNKYTAKTRYVYYGYCVEAYIYTCRVDPHSLRPISFWFVGGRNDYGGYGGGGGSYGGGSDGYGGKDHIAIVVYAECCELQNSVKAWGLDSFGKVIFHYVCRLKLLVDHLVGRALFF